MLDKALKSLKKGDTFVISKLDRLARGTKQLLTLAEFFEENEINFVSVQDSIDTSTPIGKFFFTVMSAFAEMEAALIRERVLSGLEAAKESGVILGRPPLDKHIDDVVNDYLNTELSISAIAKKYNVSRPTVYHYLKKREVGLRK